MKGRAIVTGADGGMGRCITEALAKAGYEVVMICIDSAKAQSCRDEIARNTANERIRIKEANLADMSQVEAVANDILEEGLPIDLLMNNAGTLSTHFQQTADGLEQTVAVNYMAPYLLTRQLLPLLHSGSRVVAMVSCTYAIGKITSSFFTKGKEGAFWRIPIYSNTKLALWLFIRKLSQLVAEKGILVNAADPGVVSTGIISMDMWFDPLTDIFFRPFIRTPQKGAATAIHLLLDSIKETGGMYASCHPRHLSERYLNHPQMEALWNDTETYLRKYCRVTF